MQSRAERVHIVFSSNEGNNNLIVSLSNGFLYLDVKGIAAHGFDPDKFENAVTQAALKEKGIVRCYTRAELRQLYLGNNSEDSLGRSIAKSVSEDRSGDIALLTAEYSFFSGRTSGTTHGSPYGYDQHVPLLFFGSGMRCGRSIVPCRPNDIAPTLADLLQTPRIPLRDGITLDIAAGHSTASAQALPAGKR